MSSFYQKVARFCREYETLLELALAAAAVSVLIPLLGIEEMSPGYGKYLVILGLSFVVCVAILLRKKQLTSRQLAGTSLLMAFMALFGALMLQMFGSAALDVIANCPQGKLLSYGDTVVRTVPHSHRDGLHCVPCDESHVLEVSEERQ